MRIDYNSVRAEAKKLLNVAEECSASVQICTKCQNELAVYWEGDAAQAYIGGLQKLNRKNQALAEQIRQLSQQITAVANELEESDRRLAAQIAKKNAQVTAVAAALPKTPAATTKKASATTTVAKQAVAKKNTSTLVNTAVSFVSSLLGKR